MIFRTLCFFCICLLWIWKRSPKKMNIKESGLIPPDLSGRWPIVGHALRVIGTRKDAFNLIKDTAEEIWETGKETLTFWAGPRKKYYIISDPDDCALVLNTCLHKDYYYLFAKPLLGNGLTIADVPLWKKHRKFLNPAFNQQTLNEFLVVFNDQSRKMVEKFQDESGKGLFNHEKYLSVCNLEAICMTAFGTDVKEFEDLQTQYIERVDEILKIFSERFQKIWLHNDFMYSFSGMKKRQDALMRRINEFSYLILKKKQAELEQNTQAVVKPGQFKPFMTQLLHESNKTGIYSDEDILSEINTLVVAAFDTSSCTVTIALMLLGAHPEVQQKAFDEIQKVFQNSDRDVDKEDLPKLQFLEAVLKETLRMYPIAPIVSRYLVQDIRLKNSYLKAENGVIIHFWALHRHPKWGPDAHLFKPERWLDPSTLPQNPNFFAGFSLGRRGCIGKTYAMMSMKTILVYVLRRFIIRSDTSKLEQKMEMVTLLRLGSGQHISIEERKTNVED